MRYTSLHMHSTQPIKHSGILKLTGAIIRPNEMPIHSNTIFLQEVKIVLETMLNKLMRVRPIIAHIKMVLSDYLSLIFCAIRGMSICDVYKNSNLNGIVILSLSLILGLQCIVLCKVYNIYNSSNGESFLTHPKLLIQPLRPVTMPCIPIKKICLEI